jgi:hypothetical protein
MDAFAIAIGLGTQAVDSTTSPSRHEVDVTKGRVALPSPVS